MLTKKDIETHGGLNNHTFSATEPSTPKSRVINTDQRVSSSATTKPRYANEVHLPPLQLPLLTKKLSLGVSNSLPGSSRRPKSRPGSSQGNRRFSDILTPTRSRSDANEIGKNLRRRSSMIKTATGEVTYDPNYVGPITIDYLKFFCRVSVKEKERNSENEENGESSDEKAERATYVAEDEKHLSRNASPPNERLIDFDHSLPLPSEEDYFKSPQIAAEQSFPSLGVSNNDQHSLANDQKKDKTNQGSYLERILQARKEKARAAINEAPKTGTVYHEITNTTEDTGGEKDVLYDGNIQRETQEVDELFYMEQVPGIDSDPLTNADVADSNHNNQNTTTDEHNQSPAIGGKSGVPSTQIDTYSEQFEELQQINQPFEKNDTHNESFQEPEQSQHLFEELDNIPDVIEEEFTLQNADYESFGDNQEEMMDEGDEINPEPNDNAYVLDLNWESFAPPVLKEETNRFLPETTQNNPLPLNMVKRVVKTLRLSLVSNEQKDQQNASKKKVKQYTPEVYNLIQKCSDELLQNVVSDLEAYSTHRTNGKGGSINIKDTLLYLSRIKFGRQKLFQRSTVDEVSMIAQEFLPLELLIALNNDLDPFSKSKIKHNLDYESSDPSDSDSAGEISHKIRRLQTFSDSETE
ncbi:uncharacterized protein PRCAT00001513001 [Priceomyces carsonii]|uniref:uncharacterized protein n=1 Tax=Priceomyces carsonii TaxID=28549 RepID=UPI002ED781DC|nr:unnamed protein product [Priceomyces carsonii]